MQKLKQHTRMHMCAHTHTHTHTHTLTLSYVNNCFVKNRISENYLTKYVHGPQRALIQLQVC